MPHRCLEIQEILLIIGRELREISLRSLANFALTSSVVCEAALDALWEEQYSLVPILKLFPECHVRARTMAPPLLIFGTGQALEGVVARKSWVHAQTYARRVKYLEFEGCDGGQLSYVYGRPRRTGYTIAMDSLGGLLASAQGEPLFPRLRELDCIQPAELYPELLLNMPTVFVPTLRELCIAIGNSEEHIALVRSLPGLCPDLTHLVLNCAEGLQAEWSDTLQDVILGWSSLVTIRFPDSRAASLAHLGQCTTLERMTITLNDNILADDTVSPVAFETILEYFAVEASDPTLVERFLQLISVVPLRLRAFDIQCDEDARMGAYDVRQRNLARIASALDPSIVEEIVYYQEGGLNESWGAVPPSALLQFTAFPRLTHLALDCWIDVTDNDLATIAGALPELESFSLDVHAEYDEDLPRETRTTLAGLVPFAHHCQSLMRLCVRLDATEIPAVSDAPEAEPKIHHPVRMYFADSDLEDPVAVAAYLLRIFPNGCSVARRPPSGGTFSPYRDTFDDDEQYNVNTVGNWPAGRWSEVYNELLRLQQL
ncbi:hypothetical protein BD626DRAFT_410606 [Schizophyllum amplum]|uniref:F-box domain-containing protein n=1 Tax=Schizophyllum amplum TaxID=97359 RepID=A0A550C0X8_9AGAR|nr:hypothetical protein BD626DRAFT_410606 [Auriculariopsis ampla]